MMCESCHTYPAQLTLEGNHEPTHCARCVILAMIYKFTREVYNSDDECMLNARGILSDFVNQVLQYENVARVHEPWSKN